MKGIELQQYLQSLDTGWVNREQTVDTFKAGDPETELTGVAVGWMSYTWALERAQELSCNLFITHEPTFYDHRDAEEQVFRFPAAAAKRELLARTGMVVLRCHDLWDQMPDIGIPDSWAQQLGLGRPVAGDGYFRVHDVSGRSARDVARQIAARTAELGQEAVQLLGPAEAAVSRLAIGTGAITPMQDLLDQYRADMVLCTDDGFSYWRDGGLAVDARLPVAIVNHAVAELNGMRLLADHLNARFPQLPVYHIAQKCPYSLVTA